MQRSRFRRENDPNTGALECLGEDVVLATVEAHRLVVHPDREQVVAAHRADRPDEETGMQVRGAEPSQYLRLPAAQVPGLQVSRIVARGDDLRRKPQISDNRHPLGPGGLVRTQVRGNVTGLHNHVIIDEQDDVALRMPDSGVPSGAQPPVHRMPQVGDTLVRADKLCDQRTHIGTGAIVHHHDFVGGRGGVLGQERPK